MPGSGAPDNRWRPGVDEMFTQELFFGMNLVTLTGFVLMGIGLTLNRQQKVRLPMAFTLMGAGTLLLLLGLYVATPSSTP
jgi:hypothetical protein